jgi:serine phosphatase RsbU (regulator of sigma subunit)
MAENQLLLAHLLQELDRVPAGYMMDTAVEVLGKPLGLRYLWVYMADFGEQTLDPVPNRKTPSPPSGGLNIRGSIAGRAFLSGSVVPSEDSNGGPALWIPLRQRSESVGVLALGVQELTDELETLAPAIGLIMSSAILGARRHSDLFDIARGAKQLRLAAAMQWDMLPIHSYTDPRIHVAGGLEPAYDIGGDAFDFASNVRRFHVAIFDAMGRGLEATLLASLAIGAYRLSRKRRSTLLEVGAEIDQAVQSLGEGEKFVTGHICWLDADTGDFTWMNAGHPLPLLVRDGRIDWLGTPEPQLPFGLGPGEETVSMRLQPDDLLLFYSDGLIDARAKGGTPFGMEAFRDLISRRYDPSRNALPELVRMTLDAVIAHSELDLRDDATLVAVRWMGPDESLPAAVPPQTEP